MEGEREERGERKEERGERYYLTLALGQAKAKRRS